MKTLHMWFPILTTRKKTTPFFRDSKSVAFFDVGNQSSVLQHNWRWTTQGGEGPHYSTAEVEKRTVTPPGVSEDPFNSNQAPFPWSKRGFNLPGRQRMPVSAEWGVGNEVGHRTLHLAQTAISEYLPAFLYLAQI